MRTWIVNASPLILLGKIQRLELLDALVPTFLIPSPVVSEILAGPDNDPARNWIQCILSDTHLAPNFPAPPEILAWDLGAGETAVISLAYARKQSICVLDDRAARNCAAVYELPVIGTLGILIKAKIEGLIPQLQPEIENLLSVGSLLAPAVIQKALMLAGE